MSEHSSNDSTLQIRPYQSDDRQAWDVLAAQTVADGTVFPFESVEGVAQYWFAHSGRIWVACREHVILGTYVLKPNSPDRCSHVANAGYMVDLSSRGQGIGYALGKHSIDQARQLGFRAMQFNQVVATNRSALRLWLKLGFQIVGTVPQAFRHPVESWVDLHIMHRFV